MSPETAARVQAAGASLAVLGCFGMVCVPGGGAVFAPLLIVGVLIFISDKMRFV